MEALSSPYALSGLMHIATVHPQRSADDVTGAYDGSENWIIKTIIDTRGKYPDQKSAIIIVHQMNLFP